MKNIKLLILILLAFISSNLLVTAQIRVVDNKGTLSTIDASKWTRIGITNDIYAKYPGNVGIGTNAPAATLHNAGSTILGTTAYANAVAAYTVPAATVNGYSGLVITQTATAAAVTLTAPTDFTAGRIFTVSNAAASAYALTVAGIPVPVGTSAEFVYDGAAWTSPSSSYSSPITLVNSTNLFSTAIDAGVGVTASTNSNFFGYQAGSAATTASSSNFFGSQAGNGATSASNSNFLGNKAGYHSTGATYSNFFGNQAGYSAPNASHSNFLGSGAGTTATNASYSNFLGYLAGSGAINASYSTLLGFQVANETTSGIHIGTNNIIIGTNISLPNATANALNLGGVLFGTGIYSTTSGDPLTTAVSGGKIGIGTNAPAATLHNAGSTILGTTAYANAVAAYTVSAATVNGYSGLVITQTATAAAVTLTAPTDFTAGRIFTVSNAAASAYALTVAGIPVPVGTSAEFVYDGAAWTSPSSSYSSPITLVNSTNLFSTAIDAGVGVTASTNSNFFGYQAGLNSTAASNSNFIGFYTGQNATNAFGSNFLGVNAGSSATNASNSNFMGVQAGASATGANYSNFFGYWAGQKAAGASYSNFFGNSTGKNAINASYSTLLGYNVGDEVASGIHIGTNNIIIGTNITLPDATTNAMNLGGVLFGTGTYSVTNDNPSATAVSGGKIGIGVVTPTAQLQLAAGTAAASTAPLKLTSGITLTTTEAGAIEYNGAHLYFSAVDGGTRYQLDQQSITLGAPSSTSYPNGGTIAGSALSLSYADATNPGIVSTAAQTFAGDKTFNNVIIAGVLTSPSDSRLKIKIETLTDVLAKLDRMRGVSYEFKDQQKYAKGPQVGVVAQELQKVFPELVKTDAKGYLSVNYSQLTGVLIQAVKEQQAEINELKVQMQLVLTKLGLEKK